MKNKRKFFLKKRSYLLLLLLLLIILLPTLFLGSIYFSPGRSKNFAIGQNTAQINFTPGGINIFYPKDDTTFYYFHNLSWPQQITGTNTKISDPNSTHSEPSFTYFKKWLASFFPQPEFQSKTANDTSEKSPSPTPHKTAQIHQQLPKTDKKFTSKLANFTLTIPGENYSEMQYNDDSEYLVMWITPEDYNSEGEERLHVSIYPVSKGCQDTSKIPANEPTKIKLAGKYPMSLIHGSISHGDSGHYYHGVTELENDFCLNVSVKYDLKYEQRFIDILEGD